MPAPVFELAIVNGRASVEQLTEQLNSAFEALWLQGESINSITAANYEPLTGVLTLTFSDETTFSTGDLRGSDGTDGIDGENGNDGRGVESASYNASTGVLTLTFTDGTTFATGDLRGADGEDGLDGTNADIRTFETDEDALAYSLAHPNAVVFSSEVI